LKPELRTLYLGAIKKDDIILLGSEKGREIYAFRALEKYSPQKGLHGKLSTIYENKYIEGGEVFIQGSVSPLGKEGSVSVHKGKIIEGSYLDMEVVNEGTKKTKGLATSISEIEKFEVLRKPK